MAIITEAFLPKVDGVSKTSYLTIRYLQETGREVLIFAPDNAIANVGASEVVRVPSFSLSIAPETYAAVPNSIVEDRLRAFKPDLIHLASPALMSLYGMMVGRELNVPVVANYQTDLPGYARQYNVAWMEQPLRDWLRYLHNGCTLNLAPTRGVKRALKKAGFKRVRVWGRGVNVNMFTPERRNAAMRARLLGGRSDDRLLCLYVGRLANEKQVDYLHDLAKQDGIALTIVGDGYLRESLETLFADTDTVFTGYLVGDELAEAYASADVFVFAGANETFGQVAQEALASGLPAIVTERGGIGEVIQHGVTGFVVAHTPQAFTQAVCQLRDNPALLASMRQNARAVALTRPWSSVMGQLEKHYGEAVRINARFKTRFGFTTYHRSARLRGMFAAFGAWLAARFYRRKP